MPSRETELYKDKVEVSLDGRQIFYLFFGGAVIVGIVFVLGVLVGRRVEARGHVDKAHTAAVSDPLAALDRLEGSGGMAFRGALTGKDAAAPVEKKIDAIEKERAAGKDKKTEAKVEAKADDKKAEDKKAEDKKPEDKKVEDKKAEDKKKADDSDDKPVTKPSSAEAKADDKKADDKKTDDKKTEEKTRYTLQLSSFQDKAEAEAYLQKVKAQGYEAQITQAEVDGKGTFYRVRMGTYRSMESATNAKADFEKASNKTASIMKL